MGQAALTLMQATTTNTKRKAKVVAGAGGGGSSGGSESSDNLKSSALLSIVDLIGEGQIGGLVDNSPSSVFLNDTPLATKEGAYNFTNVKWGIVTGTQDQDALGDGFNSVESVTSLNLHVTNANPAVFTISDPNAGSARVVVSTPALTSTNSKGDIRGSSVEFEFQVSVNGGAFSPAGKGKISGKTRSRYQRAYMRELPKIDKAGNPARTWTIRVLRTTPDSKDSRTTNDLYVDSYSTIVDTRLSYPNSAVFGLQVNSEQFTSEPRRSYLVDGLLVKVPSNRDGATRQYVGIWDGSFKLESTDNPAWILYDLITNERYGLGQYVPSLYANAARLYEIGRYCDEMIDDGFGIGQLEPRFTINTALVSLVDAYQLISDITSVFNGMAYWTGNSMGYMADMPTPVSMLYNATNVINGEFSYQGSSRKDRHSVVMVRYNDPERNYETQTEYIEDSELIERFGIRKAEISAFGCTTRGQAHRVGKWLLYTEKHQSAVVSFKVGIDSALVMPGDVIQIMDANRSGKRHGGRIVTANINSATLDAEIGIEDGSTISFRNAKGAMQERLISSSRTVTLADGRKVTQVMWSTVLAKLPVANTVWQISAPSLDPMTARVVSVGHGDNPGEFNISAIEHNPSKFDHIERDILLETTKLTTIDASAVVGPTPKVMLVAEKFIEQDSTRYSLNISWEQVPGAANYLVKYRKEGGNWVALPAQSGLSVDVENVFSGNYQASVQAVSALNSKSSVTYSELTPIEGSASVLPKLVTFTAEGAALAIDLNWEFSNLASGVKYTEIQYCIDYDAANPGVEVWTSLADVPFPASHHTLSGLGTLDRRYFRARIVDGFKQYGEWSDIIFARPTSDIDALKEILDGQVGLESLDSVLTGNLTATAADAKKAIADAKLAADAAAKEVKDRAAAVAAETKARTAAIAAEATARATALAKEMTDREAALAQEAIDRAAAIAKETTDRTTAITQETNDRKAALAAEAAARAQEAKAQADALAKEVIDRDAAISTVAAAEAAARQAAIAKESSDRATAIAKETTDRAAAITAAVKVETTARTTALAEEAKARIAVNDAVVKEVKDRAAAVAAESTARATAIAAEATARNTAINQEIADRKAAVVAESNARTRAITDKAAEINADVAAKIKTVNDGITKEITDRAAGDTAIRGELNTYKSSNNAAVAAVVKDVKTVTDAHSATASDVSGLQSSMSTVQGTLSKKADAAALSALDTKVTKQGDDLNTKSGQITQLSADIENVNLRGQDLVSNGLGQLQSNKYWKTAEFTAADKPSGAGAFVLGSGKTMITGDELIAVDPTRTYRLSYALRQMTPGVIARAYGMFVPYDVEKQTILPYHYMAQTGTLTKLAKPLKKGDTTMTLEDASNWNNTAPSTSTHLLSAIFWNYTDGTGYTWPVNTYSRNYFGNLYTAGSIKGNVITLRTPWAGADIPAGTDVSNGSSGGNYLYLGLKGGIIPQEWTTFSDDVSGVHQSGINAAASTKLPMMTAYVRVGFLVNRQASGSNDPASVTAFGAVSVRDWSVASDESLAKTAALNATNTEVARVNGVVTAQGTSIAKLQSDLSATDTKAGTAVANAATAQQTANTAVTATGANASRISELDASFKSYKTANDSALIETNAKVSTVEKTSTDADKALGLRIDSVQATAKTDKAETAALVNAETTARTTADTALSGRIDSLTASTNTELGKTNAAVTAEQTARSTADTALGQRIDAVIATAKTDKSELQSAVTTEQTARSTADAALGQRIDSVVATAKTDKSDVTALVTAEQTARSTADTALGKRIDAVTATAKTDKADVTALVNAETTARATADAAMSERVDALTTTVANNDTKVTGSIADVAKSVTTLEGSTNTKFSSLESQLSNTNKEVGTVKTAAANAQSTANTAVTGNAATASRVAALESEMDAVEADVKTRATAAALSATNTEVSRVDGVVKSQGSSITKLTNDLSTTTTNADNALDAVTVKDTRSANELPNWYWKNHAKRIVNEFKFASVMGVTGLGTYVNVETRVYYGDSSGGPILQVAHGVTNPLLQMVRRSSGSKDAAVWTEWEQPLKTMNDTINTKASTTALNALDSKVTQVDGKTVANASKIETIEANLEETDELLGTVKAAAATAQSTADTAVTNTAAVAGRTSTLEGKMTAVEADVKTRATAVALNSTNTEVSRVDGVTKSQGTAITGLTNAINHTTTGLATKASTTALNAVDNKVTAANGRIDATNSEVRTLKSSISSSAESLTANGSQGTLDVLNSAAASLVDSAGSMTGKVIKIAGQAHASLTASKMLIDPTKLYKLRLRYRRIAGVDNRIYVAVLGFNAAGTHTVTANNELNPVGTLISNALYPISYELPALGLWREVEYYFKGKSSGAATGNGTIATPRTFPGLTAMIDLAVLANYNKGAVADNQYEIDYFILEDATAEAANTANANAINATNTEVTRIDGVTKTQASNISKLQSDLAETDTKAGTAVANAALAQTTANTAVNNAAAVANRTSTLESKMTTVEGNVAKKADATALNNYYTKSETTQEATTIAAGEVAKYDAKLTIGGSNLYFGPNPVVLRSQTSEGRIVFPAVASGNTQRFNYLTDDNLDLSGLQIGDPTISSIEIFVSSTDTSDYTIQFGTYRFSGNGYIYAPTVDVKTLPKDTWVKLTTAPGTYVTGQPPAGINLVFNMVGRKTAGDEIRWRNFMMEKATTASSFVEADRATQAKLDANSTAIETTNTEVSRVNGEVVAQGRKISTLESNLSAVDAKAGTAVNNAATAQQTANTGVTKAEAVASSVSTLRTEYEAKAAALDAADKANAAEVVKTNTALTTAQTALSNADKALGQRIDSLTTTVSNNDTAVKGQIKTVSDSVTTLTGTVNTKTDKLTADLATANTGITAAKKSAADAQTTANSAVTANSATASRVGTLESKMTTVEGGLAKKAEASALNNYYTKSQSEDKATEIAAGEVAKYDAGLVLGGQNLIPDSKNFRVGSAASTDLVRTILADGSLQVTNKGALGSSYLATFQSAKTTFADLVGTMRPGEQFTVTVWFKAVDPTNLPTANPTLYLSSNSLNYYALNGDRAALAKGKEVPFSYTRAWPEGAVTISPHFTFTSASVGGGLVVTKWQIERGTKSSDWSPSATEIQSSLDANASAINSTNAEVTRIDGQVRSQASSLSKLQSDLNTADAKAGTALSNAATAQTTANTGVTKADAVAARTSTLEGKMSTVEGNVAKKLDATAINNYYTKAQSDTSATTIAAGEVSKYDAKLQIGGVNLATDSNNIVQSNNGAGYTMRYVKGNPNKFVNVSNNGGISTYTTKFYPAVIGKTYTVSVKVRPDVDTELSLYAITNANGTLVTKSDNFCPANVWTTLWYTFVAKVESVRLAGFQISKGFTDNVTVEYKEYQAEEGTKVTTWSPANEDIQGALDANSSAINSTNAEVTRVDGEVKAQGSSIAKLQSDLNATDTKAGTAISNAATAQSTANTGVTKADAAASSVNTLKTQYEAKVADLAAADSANTAAIAKTNTDLTNAQTALSNADKALGNRIDSLTTTVTNNDTAAKGQIKDVADSVTTLEGNTNSRLTTLTSELTKVNNNVAKKADATALNDYYTKTQADTATAGQINQFKAQLSIGGVNQLINSEAERGPTSREYLMYENSEHIFNFFEENLNKDVTISFDLKVDVAGLVQVYCSNGTHHTYSTSVRVETANVGKWVRYSVTVQPKKRAGGSVVTRSAVEFYGTYDTGRFPFVRKVQLEAGNVATDWSPSPRDTQAALNANAAAINTTNTEVLRIDGQVKSQASSLSQLQSNLSDVDAKAGNAATSAATAQSTANTGVTKADAAASATNTLKAAYEAKVAAMDKTIAANATKSASDLTSVQTTLANADKALGSRIDSLTTTVANNDTTVKGQIRDVADSVTTLSGTTNTKISSLESSLATTNANVAKKAEASALNSTNTKVSEVDGKVNTQATTITGIETKLATVESDVAKKAEASALTTTNAKVAEIDGKVTSQAQQITEVKATADGALDHVAAYQSTIDAWVDRNKVEAAMMETLAAELVPHMAGNTELFPDVEVNVGYQGVITALAEVDAATMTRVETLESNYADANAKIEETQRVITDMNRSLAEDLLELQANFQTTVDETLTPAVNNLTAKLENEYLTIADSKTAISQATTTLKSEVTKGYADAIDTAIGSIKLDSVTIPDTRSENQPPSWYWSNYAKSKVSEFKSSTAVGLTSAQVGNTYGTFTTIVPWTDSSGGPIKQIMEGASESNVYVRQSISTTAWSAWVKQGAAMQTTITEQAQTIDGIKGVKTVTIDNNGVLSGYGLVSELVGGKVTSAFGVNADQFYVGSPATGKKVFAVVNGQTVINDAVIGNLSASKITTGTLHGDRIEAGTLSADKLSAVAIDAIALKAQNIVVYKDKSKPKGVRLELIGGLLSVYDDANILRVRLGFWS